MPDVSQLSLRFPSFTVTFQNLHREGGRKEGLSVGERGCACEKGVGMGVCGRTLVDGTR